jgi:lipoate-protein ligase A
MADPSFPRYCYDDDLIQAARRDGRARVRVYRLIDTAVVLGAGSRAITEVRLDACQENGIPILRRRGGGCAVALDPGDVIVSLVAVGLPFGHHRRHLDILTNWLIDGLARIGLPGVRLEGICDLVYGHRKVGGACLHRSRDLLHYSASLLVDPDIERVTRYLKHPPREPDYRQGRSHAMFMGSLLALADDGPRPTQTDPRQVAAELRRVLEPPDLVSQPRVARRSRSYAGAAC